MQLIDECDCSVGPYYIAYSTIAKARFAHYQLKYWIKTGESTYSISLHISEIFATSTLYVSSIITRIADHHPVAFIGDVVFLIVLQSLHEWYFRRKLSISKNEITPLTA